MMFNLFKQVVKNLLLTRHEIKTYSLRRSQTNEENVMPINLQEYFDRIGYKGSVDVSIDTLKAIHAAQVFSIPFENLAIHELQNVNSSNALVRLDEKSLFEKLVTNKRGGYCHENNELLAIALTQMGFKVDRLAARVLTAPNLPITHKLLLVTIKGQKWIADAAFGSYGLFEPIPLLSDQEVTQYGDRFQLTEDQGKFTFQIFLNAGWKNLYEFTSQVFHPVDYEPMNYYTYSHPNSIFVKNRICVMPTPEGRVILNNDNLKIVRQGKETVISVEESGGYLNALKKYFGIELPADTQFKKLKEESSTSWYSFFAKAAVGVGMVSSALIAQQLHQKLR
jgi:N-hydroxyarylamine O-acetyltransferase